MPATIPEWANAKEIDVVVWTGLPRKFEKDAIPGKTTPFSVETARTYLQNLPPEAKARAAEYMWRAPDFVQTPLRTAMKSAPWFPPQAE